MTFEELLAAARSSGDPVAVGVVDLLGESPGCGFEPPVVDPGMVTILDGSEDPSPAYQFTPSETRWFAAELLRAADHAEALKLAKGSAYPCLARPCLRLATWFARDNRARLSHVCDRCRSAMPSTEQALYYACEAVDQQVAGDAPLK